MKPLFLSVFISLTSFYCVFSQSLGVIAHCPVTDCQFAKNYGDESEPIFDCEHKDYRLSFNNINWKSNELLLDPYNGLMIMPIFKNNKKYYKVFYSTEKNKKSRKGIFEASDLEKMNVYKFSKKQHSKRFWLGKRNYKHNFME